MIPSERCKGLPPSFFRLRKRSGSKPAGSPRSPFPLAHPGLANGQRNRRRCFASSTETRGITTKSNTNRQDVYSRGTNKIIADLEEGERLWLKPWSAANTEGRVVRPLRHSGEPYKGISTPILWGKAIDIGFACLMRLPYLQAQKLGGQVDKVAIYRASESMPVIPVLLCRSG